jgi:hypothetical protein
MTLVTLPMPMAFPGFTIGPYGTPGLGTVATLDASGEYVSYIFCAREAMTISHIGFMVGAVANSPTVEVRIETVDATGLPSGTLWDSPTNTTNATSGTLTNAYTLVALTAAASVTKGQMVCVKLLWGGVATSTVVIQHMTNTSFGYSGNLPYAVLNTGTPTKGGLSTGPLLSFGSSSTTFYNVPSFIPTNAAIVTATFNNTNSPKRGLLFTPTFNCRAVGIRWYKSGSSGAGDYNIGLYTGDASGTELSSSSTALDGDHAVNNQNSMHIAFFDNAVTLTAGTAYRVAVEPTTATNCNFSTITLPSSDYYSATAAGSSSITYSSLVSGTWTDSTTQIPLMDVLLDQIDDGAGTGGGGGQRVISG